MCHAGDEAHPSTEAWDAPGFRCVVWSLGEELLKGWIGLLDPIYHVVVWDHFVFAPFVTLEEESQERFAVRRWISTGSREFDLRQKAYTR